MDRDHQVALWDNESPGTWRRWRNEPAMLHWRFSQGEEALLGKRNVYFAYYHLKSGTTETRRMTYKVRQLQARGDEVFLSTEGGALAVMKMEPRAEVRRLQSQGKDLGALAVTQDGSLVAVANWEGEVSLWSRDTGRRLWHAREHTDGVPELAVSPNQEVIASRSWDETVKLLDVRREAPAVTLRGHDQSINCMRFSPDGTRLATGGRDATVRIWDVATGRLLWLREASSEVHFLTWSPEGVLQARTRAGRLWTWALGPMRDPDLRSTGALTNLRVCQNSDRVVEVVPFPAPESVWAPEALCRQAPDPEED
jgi:WD40 repeat protein